MLDVGWRNFDYKLSFSNNKFIQESFGTFRASILRIARSRFGFIEKMG